MNNFIKDLDEKYEKVRNENQIKKENRDFVCNIPLSVEIYGNRNNHYIIRKGKYTRFLYVKNNCRVYFTDADILTMLLQIRSRHTMDQFIDNLKHAYADNLVGYYLQIEKERYQVEGIPQIVDDQILTNLQDVDISFDELLVLINLILSKDRASAPLWEKKPDFFKHTLSKYISLLKHYYYGDMNARTYLSNMGYKVDENIYSNYDTQDKRDEKRNFFSDFKMFENSGIL